MKIKLTKDYTATVDAKDYTRCVALGKWIAAIDRNDDGSIKNVYAKHRHRIEAGVWIDVMMHRFVLGLKTKRIKVDHKDHDGLNNSRKNLRRANLFQNGSNARKRKDSTSGYKGVSWSKLHKQWRVRITSNKVVHFIGCYKTLKEAALAYKKAAVIYHGRFACATEIR
jgi:AP2-like factor (euAP2 lineage)